MPIAAARLRCTILIARSVHKTSTLSSRCRQCDHASNSVTTPRLLLCRAVDHALFRHGYCCSELWLLVFVISLHHVSCFAVIPRQHRCDASAIRIDTKPHDSCFFATCREFLDNCWPEKVTITHPRPDCVLQCKCWL